MEADAAFVEWVFATVVGGVIVVVVVLRVATILGVFVVVVVASEVAAVVSSVNVMVFVSRVVVSGSVAVVVVFRGTGQIDVVLFAPDILAVVVPEGSAYPYLSGEILAPFDFAFCHYSGRYSCSWLSSCSCCTYS